MNLQLKVKLFVNEVISEMRTCAHCGSLSAPEVLCEFCWHHLPWSLGVEQRSTTLDIDGKAIPHYYLLDWDSNKNPACAALLTSIKGGRPKAAFDRLAAQFAVKTLSASGHNARSILVPAPGKDFAANHAAVLAESFAQALSAEVDDCLENLSVVVQKNRSKRERNELRFTRRENISHRHHRVIFVDDVVTTGSTARAAYRALGRPPGFEVWSIAYRHLATDHRQ